MLFVLFVVFVIGIGDASASAAGNGPPVCALVAISAVPLLLLAATPAVSAVPYLAALLPAAEPLLVVVTE